MYRRTQICATTEVIGFADMKNKMMKHDFSGKKALVTGGSRGIGRDIVDGLAKANIAKVYVLGRNQESLDKLKKEVKCAVPIRADVSDWNATRAILEKMEPLDFLVNNAGTGEIASFFDITEANIDRTLGLNLKGTINVSQVICKRMMERGGGVVVNISSIAATRPFANITPYCASKAAIDAVTRQMALELSPLIRVNTVSPTVVWTELGEFAFTGKPGDLIKAKTPFGRFAELKEVTDTVLFMLSDASSMIQGHILPVDGGFLAI